MVNFYVRSLGGCTFLALVAIARAISSTPSASTEMICSPTDATDCYPRVFEPTKDFQVIREGQDLPPGLHVRMDIYSGLKEARLNIPMEGEEGTVDVHEDIPIERAVVVVEQPETEEVKDEQPAMRDQVPIKPPVYETAGKIPPPPPSGDEFSTFQKAMLTIKMEARAFDSALDDLTELSHDIYYGVEIAKDGPVLEKLICLTLSSGSKRMPANEKGRDHKAASILASAIQNNPTALKEVSSFWRMVVYPYCETDTTDSTTKNQSNFVSLLRKRLGREKEPQTLKSKVAAVSGLIKEPLIRDEFLEKGGMELLLAIFLKKGEQFDIVKKRVAQLVTDTFLDEGMGAQLGVWPKSPVSEAKVCGSKERMLENGCWEHHVGEFLTKNPTQLWAEEFLTAIKEQRAKYGDSVKDREL
jgi:nucleotide exchange factor SIL1